MSRWIAPTGLLFLLCLGTGYFGWRTGIPAEWIFAIWPPAGIAVVGVYIWGRRVLPAIVLGDCGCYLLLIQAYHPGEYSPLNSIACCFLLGVVAALQAWAGAWLLKRFVADDAALTRTRSVIAFLLICGPVQALVSTLLGPPIRIAFGHRSADEFALFLFDWWLNEITGGCAFAAIMLSFIGTPVYAWRPRRYTVALPLIIVVVGFTILDEFGPPEIVALPKITRRALEILGVIILCLIVLLLLLVTGQAAAVRAEAVRAAEDLFHETSARLTAQTSLATSEARLAEAQHIARIGSWVWDPVSDQAAWSDELFRLLGYPPNSFVPTHARFLESVHPEDRSLVEDRMRAAIANEQPYDFDFRVVLPTGQTRIFHVDALIDRDASGKPIRWRGTDQDVTERVQAEEDRRRLDDRLRATQRWESLGQLAGGIAHDFNNLMGGVLGYATLAREQLPADAPTQELLKPIEEAALHAASLCQQLLTFAGKGISARATIDIHNLVTESAELIRMAVPRTVEVRIGTAHDLPIVEGDRSQLKQVLLNLVWNSADAMGPDGGVIEIRSGSSRGGCCPTQSPGHYCSTLPRGTYVWLEVRDTGCGIAEDSLTRIFDPFYTTKDVGRGLGLSAVAGIVRSHGGVVCVTSRPGVGTSIRVYLAAIDDHSASQTPPPVINTPREIPHPSPRTLFLMPSDAEV